MAESGSVRKLRVVHICGRSQRTVRVFFFILRIWEFEPVEMSGSERVSAFQYGIGSSDPKLEGFNFAYGYGHDYGFFPCPSLPAYPEFHMQAKVCFFG